ncbi:Lysocardiolipin acyltransferase 1 [Thelohanellus kitauei]|uniref:Lysocardiolipin acyltransferase 1 n=1 Tax=Thelohanellus kitauei TaxID=669202 RepID=A0A0C2IL58_THEKT|nr:Lysocardiolipin acyltransferase 1 [Thelohanellus kitauei]
MGRYFLTGYLSGILWIAQTIYDLAVGSWMLLVIAMPINWVFPRIYRKIVDWSVSLWVNSTAEINQLMGTKFFYYSKERHFNEKCMIIMNHKNELDWFYYFNFSSTFQRPGLMKIALKKPLRQVPFAGWACQLSCYLFLDRKWTVDKPRIENYFKYYSALQYPIQLLIYCEGTNFCKSSKSSSDRYALKHNLPIYNYVLHPRVTGFTFIYNLLSSSKQPLIDSVYDMTVGYVGEAMDWTDLISGNWIKEVHMVIEKFSVHTLPKTEEELENWVKDRWAKKEKLLEGFYTHGSFPAEYTRLEIPKRRFGLSLIAFKMLILFASAVLFASRVAKILFVVHVFAGIILSKYGLDDIIVKNTF